MLVHARVGLPRPPSPSRIDCVQVPGSPRGANRRRLLLLSPWEVRRHNRADDKGLQRMVPFGHVQLIVWPHRRGRLRDMSHRLQRVAVHMGAGTAKRLLEFD